MDFKKVTQYVKEHPLYSTANKFNADREFVNDPKGGANEIHEGEKIQI